MRQIDGSVRGVGTLRLRMKNIEVVTADPTQELGELLRDVIAMRLPDFKKSRYQRPAPSGFHTFATAHTKRAKPFHRAIGKQDFDRFGVVHHVAVGKRSRAAGVVSSHPAKRRLS